MTILEDIKNALELLKRKVGFSWQKLLDQIPDQDRMESYYFDTTLNRYVLKSTLPEAEVPILDENRRLQVESPNFYELYKKLEGYHKDVYTLVNLDFLADSISAYVYDITSESDNIIIYYYDSVNGIQIDTAMTIAFTGETNNYTQQTDIKPFNCFMVVCGIGDAHSSIHKLKLMFSKQKKTKISDIAYASSWNAVLDIGASKNAIYDKLVSMIAEYVALISDVAYNESTWNAVTTIAPSKNVIRDWIEALDYYTQSEVDGLTWLEEDITDLDHDDVDAIHDNVANEITAITEKSIAVANDEFVIEDSVDSNNKKSIKMSGLRITESQITDLDHDDSDAIHDNVASEITAITEKSIAVANDEFVIEDSADSNNKKSIKMSGLRITESQITDLQSIMEIYLVIGSGNKKYATLKLEGTYAPAQLEVSAETYRNVGSTNIYTVFGIDLPLSIIWNGTTYYLHIDRIRIGLPDADINDFITQTLLTIWTDHETVSHEVNDTSNFNSIGEHDIDFTVIDVGTGVKRAFVTFYWDTATAREIEMSYAQIRYYYDT